MIETFIAVKFLKDCGNIQDVPTPYYITIPWVVVITVCGLYYLYLRIFRSDAKPYTKINEMA
jgi:phosphatidylserine synthase 2